MIPPAKELEWLNSRPTFDQLMERYPELWKDALSEILAETKDGRKEIGQGCALRAKARSKVWELRIQKSRNNPKVLETAISQIVKSRMVVLALERTHLAQAAGKSSGKVRFNLLNGIIIQKLLFKKHLTRKPASLRWVKFWWPLLTQRKLLLPLLQSKGIYCFYSKELIRELHREIGDRQCVEVAAGDGTLSRFLRESGVNIVATDDHSWSHAVAFPEDVENLDAKQALQKYAPKVVICSWPPAGNNFEKSIFLTPSVELYIMIGSQLDLVTGNSQSYKEQNAFEQIVDPALSGMVIPPDSGHVVVLFRRRSN